VNTSVAEISPLDTSNTVDLCKVGCVCSHFQSVASPQVAHQEGQKCLGYLTSSSSSRYLFFGPSRPEMMATGLSSGVLPTNDITALKTLVDQPQSLRLQLLHRLQLALKLSQSVLQFHNTAWLPPIWKLGDLAIIGSTICEQSLNTLHLSTRFETTSTTSTSGLGTSSISTSSANATAASPSPVDACCRKLGPGVYNETLFSLGIALLEIAHWQTFEKLRQGDQTSSMLHIASFADPRR
jgi:hypothetical protein